MGTAVLHVDGRPSLPLSPGDVVLLPGGIPHILAARPDAPVRPFDHVRAEALTGAGGELRIGEFNRAFTRRHGLPPGRYRTAARHPD